MKNNFKSYLTNLVFIITICNAEVFDGYTLFSPTGGGPGGGTGGTSYLLDNDMNVVHTWVHPRGAASMPYLLADSSIIYPYRVPSPTMSSGGVGGGIAHIAWDGTILWQYTISDDIYQHHHDVEPLPNGNILVVAWERRTAAETYALGRQVVDNPLGEMWSTAILELEMVPPNQANIVWEWHLWDHLVQDQDPSLPGYGVISEHPELMDINFGDVGGGGGPGGSNADWMHINAIDYNPILDQIAISSRHQNEIYIIDHSTTTEEAAGHSGGNSGKGGDFLYRWGNPQSYDRGTSNQQQLDSQHGVNWIPEGYPGAGNLILYNNNFGNQSSAVFEIVTPLTADSTNYILAGPQPYGPLGPAWTHTGGFHSNVQSGAFRLPNGNTLISVADDAIVFEVDSLGSTVWEYTHGGTNTMIARAQKYATEFLGGSDTTGFPDYRLGDVNFDYHIDVFDLCYTIDMVVMPNCMATESCFNEEFYEPSPPADFNEDSVIDYLDIMAFVYKIMQFDR